MSIIPYSRELGKQAKQIAVDDEFRRGFAALSPLWPGVIAFAIAFAIAARAAGFTALEIVTLSLFVFAGSAQVATVVLYASGVGFVPIVLTTLLLNLRHTFYGLSINRWLPERTTPSKPVLAFFITDESYGITVSTFLAGQGSARFLFGASTSLWTVYISATIAGTLLGGGLLSTGSLGLEFIFPLTFIALLIPLLRTAVDIGVAIIAAMLMFTLDGVVPDGASIVVVIVVAALAGVAIDQNPQESGA